MVNRHRGYGGGSHLGDQSPVHGRQGLSCIGAEELDHRHVGMLLQLRIAGIESDHLGAHHGAVHGRHDPEPAAIG